MISKDEVKLGALVTFDKYYDINPKWRIPGFEGVKAKPCTFCEFNKGMIVGKRSYIMSNWSRNYDSDEGGSIKGKTRPMLLIAVNLRTRHVLVDLDDATLIQDEK